MKSIPFNPPPKAPATNYRPIIREILEAAGHYRIPEPALKARIESSLNGLLRNGPPIMVDEARLQSDLLWHLERGTIGYAIDQETGTKSWYIH
jgi:hypothetical protein